MNNLNENILKKPKTLQALTAIFVARIVLILLAILMMKISLNTSINNSSWSIFCEGYLNGLGLERNATSEEAIFLIGCWIVPLTFSALSLLCIAKHKYNLLLILICLHAFTNLTKIVSLIFDVIALALVMSRSVKGYFKRMNPKIAFIDEDEGIDENLD